MGTLTLNLPSMYGDHHVVEVRRLLLEMPGVTDVYASSCFQVVEVIYDPAQVIPNDITACLENAGYTEELNVPVETGVADYQQEEHKAVFRHTAAYANVGSTVSFAQKTAYAGRPLWPCPGIGVVRIPESE